MVSLKSPWLRPRPRRRRRARAGEAIPAYSIPTPWGIGSLFQCEKFVRIVLRIHLRCEAGQGSLLLHFVSFEIRGGPPAAETSVPRCGRRSRGMACALLLVAQHVVTEAQVALGSITRPTKSGSEKRESACGQWSRQATYCNTRDVKTRRNGSRSN